MKSVTRSWFKNKKEQIASEKTICGKGQLWF